MPSLKEQEGSNYQLLQDNSSQNGLDNPQTIQHPSQERKCQNILRLCIWQIAAAISTIGFAIILTLYLQLLSQAYPPRLHCGSSVEEAVLRGCTWDTISKYWLPAECPRIGIPENAVTDWNYYTTPQGGETVDITGTDGSGYKWWSTEKEHSMHCAYLLVRMGYVVSTSGRVDNTLQNFPHTRHCALFLLDRALLSPTANNITTKGKSPSKVGSC
ncbi:hypothetical protein B0J14DRAFT_604344 [Halenospora varia]|nr:hypothetical protein B0J14DRAFT_604344 [Halenospora varia]